MRDIYTLRAIRSDTGEEITGSYIYVAIMQNDDLDDRVYVIQAEPWRIGYLYLKAFKKIEIRKNGKFFWSYVGE